MAVTQRQIDLLAPYLEGNAPTHNNVDKDTGEITREWNLHCPLHPDAKRSASLNVDKGLFYCNVCGGMQVSALVRRKDEWRPPASLNGNGHAPDVNGAAPDKPIRPLSEGLVGGWASSLLSNASRLQWLHEIRGINAETVAQYEIGWDSVQNIYTIPVRDEEAALVNIRYYNPKPGERRKIWSENGYGSPPRLYPISTLLSDPPEVIISAGEWDTLLLLQYGFMAVTRTAGENHWDMGWAHWFRDRRVWVGQDADKEGVAGNRKIAMSLEKFASEMRIIELPYPIKDKHGEDLTDLLLDYGPDKLHELLQSAPVWGKGGKPVTVPSDLDTVTVLDTSDASQVGKPVRVVVTVKGRREPGYVIPKQVHMICTQDAGNKCQICPMRAAQGETMIEVTPDNPLVLRMIDYRDEDVAYAIADSYGVPGGKCQKLQQEVEEYQAVEVLFTRPALDYSDGWDQSEGAARYKNLRITSVGRHDTPPNNTIAAIGALQPNPKTQSNEFLVHELQVLETSVDRFEVTDEVVDMLTRFQSARPLYKVAEINKNLSEHVTRIYGRPEMHALMDLVFHSVLSFKFAGQSVSRGWLEALIVGDTRTGKSEAAQRLTQHYGAGEVISCEAATFAGVVGGVQQLGGRDWAVTWGVVPINDRRLVVMDEISGLTHEEIAQMSDIRSSGQAKLIKVVQETTWARTRLLWLGNPRNTTMANYTYGVDAIKPLIGNAEDIARFDLAMAVTLFDVPSEVINTPAVGGELVYTSEACHAMLMWCWTRKMDQIHWEPGAEEKVFDLANQMGKMYIEDPPLIQAANVRIKIARLAVAIAARTFSTDDTCENVVVKTAHVDAAVQFINLLYGMDSFGYRERSKEALNDRLQAERNKNEIRKYLKGRPTLAKYLRTTGKFRRQDLDEILNTERMESNGIISTLYEARMVRKVLGDILVEPTLHQLLRETKW